MFSLICGIWIQYKYKPYYIYIEIYTEHVPESGVVEETKGAGKGGKKVSSNELHHICVGRTFKEHTENC
jgi:hypothetical protein